jgi:hypothetical protein
MANSGRARRAVPAWLLAAGLVGAWAGADPSVPSGAQTTATAGLTARPSSSATAAASRLPSETATASPATGWAGDIDALLRARDEVHPDGWHGMPRAEWVAAADAVRARLPGLTDDQALVEMVRLAAMPGWAGRDGHTGIFPFIPGTGTHEFPVRWWRFPDGLRVTAVAPGVDRALVGARVTAIGGRPIDEVQALVDPLAPRDNPSTLLAYGPLYLRCAELLVGLGVIDAVGPTTFSVVDVDGTARDVVLDPITPEADLAWNSGLPHRLPATDAPWLARQSTPLWWEELPTDHALVIQQNEVSGGIGDAITAIRERLDRGGIDRVILDLRHNGGGDNRTLRPFENLLEEPSVDRPGHLYVLIGRITFSAAANFATDLERETSAIFAGEAMGGSPNLYGDAREIPLPDGRFAVYMATTYWERSTPDDARITIEPDLAVDLTWADYAADRDPVLHAVLAAP